MQSETPSMKPKRAVALARTSLTAARSPASLLISPWVSVPDRPRSALLIQTQGLPASTRLAWMRRPSSRVIVSVGDPVGRSSPVTDPMVATQFIAISAPEPGTPGTT